MDFQQVLKTLYKKQNQIAPLIEGLEGEIPEQTLDDYYVKLKTIIKEDDDKKQGGNYETISGQKQEVEMEDIFSEPSIRKLLILGGAGVGKSTLMQYMAYRWSTSDLWNDKFDYVYRVPLKILLNTEWKQDYDINQREDELKCLIHHNLVSQGAGKGCKLEDMPWLEKKDKILLLLDGYDEVSHERNYKFKGIFESIFKHENIILTSRPNAVDKQMAEKFGKKIENTGLDYEGLNKYLTQYFRDKQEKGKALQEFLDKNSSLKAICHVPVNIAMMCFIWSEGDSDSASQEISNMSDLYKQVVDHLGFRHYAKFNSEQNRDDLMSQWRGGEIHLDELQVLEYTAYKGMTGGGLQVPEDKRFETLIIKGMTAKGDKIGISVQSSINYLSEKLNKSSKDMPTINKVYKYGLLKPEGAQTQDKKELSETDLHKQSFSFIHLSFQEFLTAFYFVKNLLKENNKEEQQNIANFIAQHRNEPRYLMTFKLMAGVLSAENERAEQAIKTFWDAIMCNPDGVLELGVEAKVSLLMHLFGQAKKEDTLDKRIPNLQTAVDLIDSVVLQDLAKWPSQLKESGYISDNIKEGLLQFLIKDNKTWMGQISSKLQAKFTKQTKKPHDVTIEPVLEITLSFLNEFSQDQHNQIFIKLTELIKNRTNTTWNVTKKLFEALSIIHQKCEITLDDDNTKKQLLEAFLSTIYDFNLTQISIKAIQQFMNIEADPPLMDRFKASIRERKSDIKPEEIIKIKVQMLDFANSPNDNQLYQDVIQTSFVPLLEVISLASVAQSVFAANTIMEIVAKRNFDSEFIAFITKALFPLLGYEKAKDVIFDHVEMLIQKVDDHQQIFQDRMNTILPKLQDAKLDTMMSLCREFGNLTKIKGGSTDPQLLSDILKLIQKYPFPFSGGGLYDDIYNETHDFIKLICGDGYLHPQTIRAVFKNLSLLSQNPLPRHGDFIGASEIVIETIFSLIDSTDTQLIQDILDIIIPLLLQSSIENIKNQVSKALSYLLGKSGDHNFQYILEKLIQPFQNSNVETQKLILRAITFIGSLNDRQRSKDVLSSMILLFKNSKADIALLILSELEEFIDETEAALIKTLVPLLQDSPDELKRAIIDSITKIISKISDDEDDENNHSQSFQNLIKALIPLFQSPSPDIKKSISKSFEVIIQKSKDKWDAQLRREVIDLLIPLVQGTEESVKKTALNGIAKIIQKTDDLQLSRDTLKVFMSQIQNTNLEIRDIAQTHLKAIVQVDKTLLRDVFNISSEDSEALSCLMDLVEIDDDNREFRLTEGVLSLLFLHLQNSTPFKNLKDLAKATNVFQLGKEIINLMTPFLQDSSTEIRNLAASNIMDIINMVGNDDIESVKNIIQALTSLAKDSEPNIRVKIVFAHLQYLVVLTENEQLVRNTFDIAISLLQELDDITKREAKEEITEFLNRIDSKRLTMMNINKKNDTVWLKGILNSLIPLFQICNGDENFDLREAVSKSIVQIGNLADDAKPAKDVIVRLIQSLFKSGSSEYRLHSLILDICADCDAQFLKDIIDYLASFLKSLEKEALHIALKLIYDIACLTPRLLSKDVVEIILSFLENSMESSNSRALGIIARFDTSRDQVDSHSVKEIILKMAPLLKRPRFIAIEIAEVILITLEAREDSQLTKDVIDLLFPYFQDSNEYAFKILKRVLRNFLSDPDILRKYLTHSSTDLRDTVASYLLTCFQKYVNTFQNFDQLSQHPLSELTPQMILDKLLDCDPIRFYWGYPRIKLYKLEEILQRYLDNAQEEELRRFIMSNINRFGNLQGPGIIKLALVAIGHEKTPKDGSDREKVVDSAKEVLNIQLKYLDEEGLTWINENCEKLFSLSPETKVFYQKVFHKLLEDGEITPLEEQLLIKFINQGLTVSLTRDGEVVFEGKRYRLKGQNIELVLEKIAKTVIEQQQDILAMQYKQHKPIFKSTTEGGMRKAAVDIEEAWSIVDKRHALKIDYWLLTRLKSLKFKTEIILLEQRSPFGDHVVYHWNQQKLIRFYPNPEKEKNKPLLQEIFGSYIYGESYQGAVFEVTDSVGQKFLENPDTKPSVEGKPKSKQIYFQQELLHQGSEDRHGAIEEELAKKLDNNRAVLGAKLKGFNLKDTEKSIIEDYYEGFVSTFSSVYTSSQAIESGKLSIDTGEDFFSPVNLFIQLTSLAPFGIGSILSSGLEAAREHIKNTSIVNEARFVKDIAIDAVALSDLVSKVALAILSNKEQRTKVLEAKDEEEPDSLINKAKNLIMEKIEKLKNLAEKYTKMKNLFEKEVGTSPAFRLGESDANIIIKEWIDMKGSQPDLRPKPEEKQKLFTKMILGEVAEVGKGNKITPVPTSPHEIKAANKSGCCEIF